MKWSKEEIENCIKLLKAGNTYEKIGTITGRSSKSVKLKLNTLKLKSSDFAEEIFYDKVNCLGCDKLIIDLKTHSRKFCSSSCSATFNNKLKVKKDILILGGKKRIRPPKYGTIQCANCLETKKSTGLIYCSQKCANDYRAKKRFEEVESGNTTLYHKRYKKYLIHKYGNKCMECGWDKVHPVTGNISIELEHIDGNSTNHELSNLKLLCPNCHSLTPTYKSLNTGNGRHKRKERYNTGKSY
jgi:5-methylcytosine-specific restriction endonuclease McrA